MNLLRSVRDLAGLAWFEAVGFAFRGIVLAASIINGTRPRGMIR